ncbi:MAG: hypothetical protein RIF33_11595 [Cyclobacteriaceae bacterium]
MDKVKISVSNSRDSLDWHIEPYQISLTFPKDIKKREAKNLKYVLWGFCDDSNLYINCSFLTSFYDTYYFKATYVGENIILVRGFENFQQKTKNAISGILPAIPHDEVFVLSYADSVLGKLNNVFMRDFLQPFPAIDHAYENEKRKNKKTMIEYIIKVDEFVSRH